MISPSSLETDNFGKGRRYGCDGMRFIVVVLVGVGVQVSDEASVDLDSITLQRDRFRQLIMEIL